MAHDTETGELQRLHRLHRGMKLVFALSALATVFVLASSTTYLVLHYRDSQSPIVPLILAAATAIIVLHLIQAMLLRKVTGEVDSKIASLVTIDDLTGVYNYRYLEQRIDQEIQRCDRGGYSLSVIYVDSDRFKEVNDRHDHHVGNQVLKQLAELLSESVRSNDMVGRMGGDEFLALLPETTPAEAQVVAGRMLQQVRQSRFVTASGTKIDFLTLSLGICSYPDIAGSREELIILADRAMYLAKQQGGNTLSVAAPAKDDEADDQQKTG